MGGGRNFSRGWPLADLSKSFSSMQLEKVSVILWFRRLQPLYYVLFSLFLSTCVLQNVWVHTMDFVSAHKLEQVPTWNKNALWFLTRGGTDPRISPLRPVSIKLTALSERTIILPYIDCERVCIWLTRLLDWRRCGLRFTVVHVWDLHQVYTFSDEWRIKYFM